MKLTCFQRRVVWWPTWLGWFCLLLSPALLFGMIVLEGESFLSSTERVAAEILVVEGWIGPEVLPEVKQEFERGGYTFLIITGGLSGHTWSKYRQSVTEIAERELLRLGFPSNQLLLAPCEDSENQRTYTSAVAAKRMMEAKGLHPKAINVVSRGAHARRTQLVFSKVFSPAIKVGIISWRPYSSQDKAWWRSSERTLEFMNESFGFTYECLLSSGRGGIPKLLLQLSVLVLCLGLSLVMVVRWHRQSRTAHRPAVDDLPSSTGGEPSRPK